MTACGWMAVVVTPATFLAAALLRAIGYLAAPLLLRALLDKNAPQ